MAINTSVPKQCEDCSSISKGIFCNLSGPDLAELSDHKVENTYKKGQNLFIEGNPTYGLYCISKGNIKISRMGENGKESIVRIATDGDVIGHRSIFSESNFSATATAMEDTHVCFLDKKYIVDLVREKPEVASRLIEKLSRDLGASERKVASFSSKNVREKLAELLLLLQESHGHKEENRTKIDLKLTREEMASLIGTATETLIRVLSEFKEDDLIEQSGKSLFIKNNDELMRIANIPM
ncbi:MAG: Crp/Fnr family transcriptional regulator [Bacteriovoracaceae bacterium]